MQTPENNPEELDPEGVEAAKQAIKMQMGTFYLNGITNETLARAVVTAYLRQVEK